MAEQNLPGAYENPYKFNAKELDVETGLYYYGARYYNPKLSVWYGVDSLAEKMPSWSPYVYTFNNPVRYTDPTGMEPEDDYRLNKNGTLSFLRSTKDNFHRIYNSDSSDNITVNKNFFDKQYSSTFTIDAFGKKSNFTTSTMFVNNNIADLSNAYKFFAKNSDVEWGYNVFRGSKTAGTLATSHSAGTINNIAALAYRVLDADPKIKLIYKSHSHPGKYNSSTGWPAYPSGFDYRLNPTNESGDRQNYKFYKTKYPGRIPSTFNVFIPDNPNVSVNYNDISVQRSLPEQAHEIEEVIIKIKR